MEKEVCICGAGTMGRGITLAMACRGIRTLLYDLNGDMLSSAESAIHKELDHDLEKKRITREEKTNILDHISFSPSISGCRSPLIIEAIAEKAEAKSALFIELDRINTPDTIFVTNTSSLSVTEIAEKTPFPERILGLHFFNPANRMKLVEIVQTAFVSPELVSRLKAFALQIGKVPVICMDTPGFIVNRVARPYYLEALRLAEHQIADLEIIDRLMESAGFKMGPFHLMDLIGNDINYAVSTSLYNAMGRPQRLKPSVLQEDRVRLGMLGRKTGRGFFQYAKSHSE
jgi:3-hydroxybutyryl-CoA dehydrogenase